MQRLREGDGYGQKHVHRQRCCWVLPLNAKKSGVADGTRTHDNRNHNPGLYQLSYSHHGTAGDASCTAGGRLSTILDKIWRARQDSNLLPPA